MAIPFPLNTKLFREKSQPKGCEKFMIYKSQGLEITYSAIISDNTTTGIRIETDSNGVVSVFDDPTASYLTWNKSYDEIFYELYECWHERMKTKKYSKEAYDFERNIGHRLDVLTKKIMNLTWKPAGYYEFKVYHPERIISAPYYQDRIVEEWFADLFVKPYAEKILHPDNVACREEKGPPAAQELLQGKIEELHRLYGNDFYFLQCDMEGYFDNVSHDKIKEQFKGMQALGFILFCNIIDNWVKYDGYAAVEDPEHLYGVPKGNLPSQWIGIMYLNEVDWYVSGRDDCLCYVRYMDDFIAFFKSKSSCKDCKIKIEKYLKENHMGVRLHPRKTIYAPITRGFKFCGWHYKVKDLGKAKLHVKNDRKKIIKKKFEKMTEDYYLGNLSQEDVKAKINGTYAFLKQGDTKEFQRYLTYRYKFTHNEETFYRKKSASMPKKKKKHKSNSNKEENYL